MGQLHPALSHPLLVLQHPPQPRIDAEPHQRDLDRQAVLGNVGRAAYCRQRGDMQGRAEVRAARSRYLPDGGQQMDMEEGERVLLEMPSICRRGGIAYAVFTPV